MELRVGLFDNLDATLVSIPTLAHHVDIHHCARARKSQFLVLVHTGLHLHRVRLLWRVAVLWRCSLQDSGRQVALVVAVVGRSILRRAVFLLQLRHHAVHVRRPADKLDAAQVVCALAVSPSTNIIAIITFLIVSSN